MAGPYTSPYAPGPERMDHALRIADLISRQGQQRERPVSRAGAYRAAAVADLVGNIGDSVMGVWDRVDKKKAEEKKLAAEKAEWEEMARAIGDPEGFDARAFLAKHGPEKAKAMLDFIDRSKKSQRREVDEEDPTKRYVDPYTREIVRDAEPKAGSVSRDWARVPDGQGGWIEGRYTDEEINRLGGQRPFSEAEKTRMIADAAAKAQIEELKPLSEKLINHTGLEQRALGVLGKVAAWAGMEDDVRFYQDARRAQATTLAARFQTGNMSEPDIDTWLTLIPDIGKDTRGSAKRKWAHIEAIIRGEAPPPDKNVPGSIPDLPDAPPPAFQPPPLPAAQGIPPWQSPPPGPDDVFAPPTVGPPPGTPLPPRQNMPFTPQDNASRQNLPFNPPNASRRGPAPGPVQASALPPQEIEDALRSKPPGVYVIKDYGRFRKMPNGSVFRVGE